MFVKQLLDLISEYRNDMIEEWANADCVGFHMIEDHLYDVFEEERTVKADRAVVKALLRSLILMNIALES